MMKSFASLLVVSLITAAVATLLWFASASEARVAEAETALVTLRYDTAADELMAATEASLLEPLIRRVAGRPTPSAVARYWSGNAGDDAVAAASPGATVREDEDLALLAVNADYRALRESGGTYQSFVARLDTLTKAYADVLRNHPGSVEAAYNYEYAVRLRRAALASKQAVQGLDPAAGVTVHGIPGAPPKDSDAKKFKMIVPMMPDERQEAEEAGRAGRKVRKG